MTHRLRPLTAITMILFVLVSAVGVSACNADPPSPNVTARVQISSATLGPSIPAGFVGISMEYRGLEDYAGTNPSALDHPFEQLLHNLAPNGGFVLRIGGDSTDWTWWPLPHVPVPGGVRYSLNQRWATIARSVATTLDGHLILGVNFEADSRTVAAGMANALLAHVGRSSITALELGNEPELYGAFPWYKRPGGQPIYGRVHGYGAEDFLSDFANIASALPQIPLAGPSAGGATFLDSLGEIAARESRLSLVTIHAYPLKHCNPKVFATPAQLYDNASLQGLADQIAGWTATAAAHHLPLRVDEMNSISCGGQKGLSTAFAPALWALDMLPRLVRAGVVGVNFHTVPGTLQALLSATDGAGGWKASVEPEYYGLLAFTQAAPTGSRMLRYTAPAVAGLHVWATHAAAGQIHVVLINTSAHADTIRLAVASGSGPATITRLRAPGLGATSGVTLGGESIVPTTGALGGTAQTQTVNSEKGAYAVSLPGASAAILALA